MESSQTAGPCLQLLAVMPKQPKCLLALQRSQWLRGRYQPCKPSLSELLQAFSLQEKSSLETKISAPWDEPLDRWYRPLKRAAAWHRVKGHSCKEHAREDQHVYRRAHAETHVQSRHNTN